MQPAGEFPARKSKEIQGKSLHFLGFLWWNLDFSTGYSGKKKKILRCSNSPPGLCADRRSAFRFAALIRTYPIGSANRIESGQQK
jgi:hypothetical protein